MPCWPFLIRDHTCCQNNIKKYPKWTLPTFLTRGPGKAESNWAGHERNHFCQSQTQKLHNLRPSGTPAQGSCIFTALPCPITATGTSCLRINKSTFKYINSNYFERRCYVSGNRSRLLAKTKWLDTLLNGSNSSLTNRSMIDVLPELLKRLPTPILPRKTILYFVSHRLVLSYCISLMRLSYICLFLTLDLIRFDWNLAELIIFQIFIPNRKKK